VKAPASVELHLIDQRRGPTDGPPWVIEDGQRVRGQETMHRALCVHAGLSSVPGVRGERADAPDGFLDDTIAGLHEPGYLRALEAAGTGPEMLGRWTAPGMEPDTPVTIGAVRTAREGVRTAISAARRTLGGARFTYSLCRPPGHHAGPSWAGGYCYLNNAAAAMRTLRAGGVARVGILDLDLHYPNGTAAFVATDEGATLHSLHAHPVTNVPDQTVVAEGPKERSFEFTSPPDQDLYLRILDESVAELAASVEVLVVSLGYDIVDGDPHGCWSLSPQILQSVGARLAAAGRPLCVVQEGGYALDRLAACGAAFAEGLLRGAR
jgi:acetoin utilization deacetylase AcuC-like enzyme